MRSLLSSSRHGATCRCVHPSSLTRSASVSPTRSAATRAGKDGASASAGSGVSALVHCGLEAPLPLGPSLSIFPCESVNAHPSTAFLRKASWSSSGRPSRSRKEHTSSRLHAATSLIAVRPRESRISATEGPPECEAPRTLRVLSLRISQRCSNDTGVFESRIVEKEERKGHSRGPATGRQEGCVCRRLDLKPVCIKTAAAWRTVSKVTSCLGPTLAHAQLERKNLAT